MLAGGLRLPRGKAWVDGCKGAQAKAELGEGLMCVCVFLLLWLLVAFTRLISTVKCQTKCHDETS